jgi:predicted N-formylglutamate amidohydrolase
VILRPQGRGRFVIFCDHASNHIPAELQELGLPPSELSRHIAWDIGAAGVTTELSRILSDGVPIPGNRDLSVAARQLRVAQWFEPYHAAVESVIADREARGLTSIALSIHSMTECLAGVARPWQIALSSHQDRCLVDPVLAALRNPSDVTVGDNQPYDLDPAVDYSTPYHAMRRNMPYLQVEFRQDEVATPAGQIEWARRFAAALVAP